MKDELELVAGQVEQQEDKIPGQEMGIMDVKARGVLFSSWPRPKLSSHPGKALLHLVLCQQSLQGLGQTTTPLWAPSSPKTWGLGYHSTVLKRENIPATFSSGQRDEKRQDSGPATRAAASHAGSPLYPRIQPTGSDQNAKDWLSYPVL